MGSNNSFAGIEVGFMKQLNVSVPKERAHHVLQACRLYDTLGAEILADPKIAQSLKAYRAAIQKTRAAFAKAGVFEACSACAAHVFGGCCFPDMEWNYTVVHLLINRLLDCPLPTRHAYDDQCLFLGDTGCLLTAKNHFCLNYFCQDIQRKLGPASMKALLQVVGEEIMAGWEVELLLIHKYRSDLFL